MTTEEQLEHALMQLRREHRLVEKPALIGTRLRMAAVGRARRRGNAWRFLPATAACLALLSGIAVYRARDRAPVLSPAATGFVALPSSLTLPAAAETTLVRVGIHKGDLRQFGLEVPDLFASDITQAEFALGEDGLARAVRLMEPVSSAGRKPSPDGRNLR